MVEGDLTAYKSYQIRANSPQDFDDFEFDSASKLVCFCYFFSLSFIHSFKPSKQICPEKLEMDKEVSLFLDHPVERTAVDRA